MLRVRLSPWLPLLLLLAPLTAPPAAQADTSVDLAAAARGYLFGDGTIGLRNQSGQIRSRQQRIRQRPVTRQVPLIESTVSISNERMAAPLQVRDSGLPPGTRIAPSSARRVNSYFTGHLHSSMAASGGADLSTGGVTFGADYEVDDNLLFGLATTRLQNDNSRGQAVAAYTSIQAIEAIYVDMNVSIGRYGSRAADTAAAASAAAEGLAQGYSVQVSHPRDIGDWSVTPFSRYERIDAAGSVDALPGSLPDRQSLSTYALGGLLTTAIGTPLGTIRPQLLVELQHERTLPAAVGVSSVRATQGLVGIGMTTRMTREMSAFAESRLRQEQGGTNGSEKRALVGLRLLF
jgi:hypothetical protein